MTGQLVDRSEEIETHAKAAGSISANYFFAYASGSFGFDRQDWIQVIALAFRRTAMGQIRSGGGGDSSLEFEATTIWGHFERRAKTKDGKAG